MDRSRRALRIVFLIVIVILLVEPKMFREIIIFERFNFESSGKMFCPIIFMRIKVGFK